MNIVTNKLFQKNKICVLILMLLFSLSSIFMQHAFVEGHEHHEIESLYCHAINNNKLVVRFRRIIKKIKAQVLKIFWMSKLLWGNFLKTNDPVAFFAIFSLQVSIWRLASILCFYFHGSKYKIVV